jgi:cytochrome d ubiquinol oxidase subunit II
MADDLTAGHQHLGGGRAPSTQLFLLVGAAVLIPVILAYTGHAYWVFRGKVTSESGYY